LSPKPITKGLITRQMWKPRFPIIDGQLVNGFLLKQSVALTEEEDRDEFLVSESRSRTYCSSVEHQPQSKYRKFDRGADIIELVDFPAQENYTNSAVCLSFQLLIRISL